LACTDDPVGEEIRAAKRVVLQLSHHVLSEIRSELIGISTIFRRRTASIVHDSNPDLRFQGLEPSHPKQQELAFTTGNTLLSDQNQFSVCLFSPAKTNQRIYRHSVVLLSEPAVNSMKKFMNQQLIDRSESSLATTIEFTLRCGLPSWETVFEQYIAGHAHLFSLCLGLNLPQIEPQRSTFL
jgi:hypothetical protein